MTKQKYKIMDVASEDFLFKLGMLQWVIVALRKTISKNEGIIPPHVMHSLSKNFSSLSSYRNNPENCEKRLEDITNALVEDFELLLSELRSMKVRIEDETKEEVNEYMRDVSPIVKAIRQKREQSRLLH